MTGQRRAAEAGVTARDPPIAGTWRQTALPGTLYFSMKVAARRRRRRQRTDITPGVKGK